MVGHQKLILLVGINELRLWLHKKTSLSTIFRINTYLSIGIKMNSYNNLLSFNDGHHKFILLIGINELRLWLHEKTSLSTIFRIKVHLSLGRNMHSHNNLLFFQDWAP